MHFPKIWVITEFRDAKKRRPRQKDQAFDQNSESWFNITSLLGNLHVSVLRKIGNITLPK